MKSSLRCSIVCAIVAGLTTSCRPAADIQPNDLRTYTVPRQPSPAQTAASPSPRLPTDTLPAAAPAGPVLEYDLPEGWTDLGASGMRLTTLRTGPDDATDAGEITIIPASGTLEGNAARWQEQLTPGASPDRVSRAIEEGEKVVVHGAESTILLLLDDAQENQQAILAAMIPLDASTSLFVKFKGPATVARSIRDPFNAFVRSIRWK
ncbi:MAG: hypothetical protein NTY17_02190 [Planctomycetia bacterium]|nr:hypothetical protein [Planctomycetia bacterium]